MFSQHTAIDLLTLALRKVVAIGGVQIRPKHHFVFCAVALSLRAGLARQGPRLLLSRIEVVQAVREIALSVVDKALRKLTALGYTEAFKG